MDYTPTFDKLLKDRLTTNTFYQQKTSPASSLKDALGEEMDKKKKLDSIRFKYGLPDKRQGAPNMQWMGDNNS